MDSERLELLGLSWTPDADRCTEVPTEQRTARLRESQSSSRAEEQGVARS